MKKIFLSALLAATSIMQAEVLECNRPEDWRYPANIFNDGVLSYSNQWRIVSTRPMIRIDPTAQYQLELEVRAGNPASSQLTLYGGGAIYDADKKELQPYEVIYIPDTGTELAEAVKKGERTLKLKNTSKWRKSTYISVAFNTLPGFGDLPNRDVMQGKVKSFVDREGYTELVWASPMKKDYPAGTRVRQHLYGGNLNFFSAPVGTEWKKSSGSISGVSRGETPYHTGKWWPGAVYFRPQITVHPKTSDTVELRNIKINVKRQDDIF